MLWEGPLIFCHVIWYFGRHTSAAKQKTRAEVPRNMEGHPSTYVFHDPSMNVPRSSRLTTVKKMHYLVDMVEPRLRRTAHSVKHKSRTIGRLLFQRGAARITASGLAGFSPLELRNACRLATGMTGLVVGLVWTLQYYWAHGVRENSDTFLSIRWTWAGIRFVRTADGYQLAALSKVITNQQIEKRCDANQLPL